MKISNQKTITLICILIVIFSSIAANFGIFSRFGEGVFKYKSIRGESIEIYGKGIYQHMSSDVAIQGIAQDYVTLFLALPILILSLVGLYKRRIESLFILAGTIGYFFVTYLFYIAMGTYNIMFLVYAVLLCVSFFGLYLSIHNLFRLDFKQLSWNTIPHKFTGGFLMVNSVLIGLLWLSIILPPLLDGTLYPAELQHYTTLIVQGFDLGLLLPTCFVSGILLVRKVLHGLIYGTVYIVFLSILMSALSAKVAAMGIHGANIFPVIIIIPLINLISIFSAVRMINSIRKLNISTTAQHRL